MMAEVNTSNATVSVNGVEVPGLKLCSGVSLHSRSVNVTRPSDECVRKKPLSKHGMVACVVTEPIKGEASLMLHPGKSPSDGIELMVAGDDFTVTMICPYDRCNISCADVRKGDVLIFCGTPKEVA